MNLEVGSTIGDYQVIGILGAGGMGQVYQVRNLISDRVEAMKVLLPDLAQNAELADRFLREIKVHASLEHPNIAMLHSAVRVDNQLLMLMEFVEGITLEQKLKNGPLPVAEAVEYTRQALAALDYAHTRGVIHRDIKPANMMLTSGGVVKLMDFGIAKSATDRRLTMTGTTIGSLYYMSPEQIRGEASLDGRSDLYSVGVSLYELVTGRHPFDGDSQFAIMSAHLEKNPVPPIELDPKLPSALNEVILMSVLKDPSARFQTAGAFRNALGSVVVPAPPPQALPTKTMQPPPAEAAAPQRSRRGLWMALGAVAAVLAAIAVIEFPPHKGTSAAPQGGPIPTAPAQQPPAQPVQQPATAPPPTQTVPSPAAAVPQIIPDKPRVQTQQPARQQAAAPARQPAASSPAPHEQQQPAQTAQQPPTQAAPPPQPQSQPQTAAPAVNAGQIEEAREQFMKLDVRANGIRSSLSTLQQQQAAEGRNLNAKFTGPANLMDNYMSAAHTAIERGDLAAAKSYMEKAELAIGRLEKDLNR
jgi:eukaryotic-like serine/threonine-protein kinase